MKKPDEWMPLHIGAYHADTTHLTRDQHGAYLLLLMAYWRRGGPLPADDARLGAIVKATPGEWRKLRPSMAEFFAEESGGWVQKRADAELAKAKRLTEAKAEAGRKGAENRWQIDGRANGKHIAEPSPSQRQSDAPLPSPSPSPKSKKDLAARMARFKEFWMVCPKKTGQGAAEKAWIKALDLADADTLIAAMRAYAATCGGKERTFIKTPGPWLNEKRWTDEGIAPAGPPANPEDIAASHDKADRYFKRGKYAETYA